MIDPRCVLAPPEIVALVADAVERRGVTRAAGVIGVSRGTVLAVLAQTGIASGSLSLLREYARRAESISDRPHGADMVGDLSGRIEL